MGMFDNASEAHVRGEHDGQPDPICPECRKADEDGGNEQPYSDADGGSDSDPAYRKEMTDAGRGSLLR